MEYLFHHHSDLYAGPKGRLWIGGRKAARSVSLSFLLMVNDEQQGGLFNHRNLNVNSKLLQRLMAGIVPFS